MGILCKLKKLMLKLTSCRHQVSDFVNYKQAAIIFNFCTYIEGFEKVNK